MDISDINKVASRKRINVEAEKLREKVSRESAKIIKLKVAQDTAYWDLKEKLQQLEHNHERLQQNMLDVQMQHEALSGQHQDELRLRPETLNKLNSTREICDVLEKYSERLKETVSRCKLDQATLCEAYQKSGLLVKDIKVKQTQVDEKNRQVVSDLEDKLRLTSEHQSQLVQFFTSTKQQCDEEIKELKTRLTTAQGQKEELLRIANDMARDLDVKKYDLDAREKTITSLQSDIKRLVQEYKSQCTEMKNTLDKQEKELKEATDSNESLKKALMNQEEFTTSIRTENNSLQDKLSTLEEDAERMKIQLEEWKNRVAELTNLCEVLKEGLNALEGTKNGLQEELEGKIQLLNDANKIIETLQQENLTIESEKTSLAEKLKVSKEDSEAKDVMIEGLETKVQEFEAKLADVEAGLQECKLTNEEKIKELNSVIETKQSESSSKGETITKLMNDIKICMEVRSRLEAGLERAKKEVENEKEAAWEKEKKLTRQNELLEIVVKDKEQELSKQMSIILEMRNDKEKLQEKIECMQSKIDNIQKELTGRPTSFVRDCPPPELDDNAALHSPPKTKQHKVGVAQLQHRAAPEFAVPRNEPQQADSLVFNILSDSSMEGDVIDFQRLFQPAEVNRRCEALSRGERPPPIPTKRRRAATPMTQGHKNRMHFSGSPISLSQLRDDMKTKEKSFFKNKRPQESKFKKIRKLDEDIEN